MGSHAFFRTPGKRRTYFLLDRGFPMRLSIHFHLIIYPLGFFLGLINTAFSVSFVSSTCCAQFPVFLYVLKTYFSLFAFRQSPVASSRQQSPAVASVRQQSPAVASSILRERPAELRALNYKCACVSFALFLSRTRQRSHFRPLRIPRPLVAVARVH